MKDYMQYYAGSLTNVNKNEYEKFLQEANDIMRAKRLEKLHISVEPTLISKELLQILKRYNVITVELEVKIANDFILKKYKAGFTSDEIKKASKMIKHSRMNLGYQLMVGFPDSTKIDEQDSAKQLIKYRPNLVRIYPVLVIEGTELATEYENNEYQPLTLAQAIERCKELIYIFNKKKIKAITVGSVSETNMKKEEKNEIKVLAGPTHQAFAQLVEDSIWYDSIVGKIKKFNSKAKEIKIEVHPSNVNNVIGYEKGNAKKIEELYSVEIKVIPNEKIKPGRLEMKILTIYED